MQTPTQMPNTPAPAVQSAQERAELLRQEQARLAAELQAVEEMEISVIEEAEIKSGVERSARFNEGAMATAQGALVGFVLIAGLGLILGAKK